MAVGMFSSTMSASETWSRCFTSARRLLPCATMPTCRPLRICGAMVSYQYGSIRPTTSFRASVARVVAGVTVIAQLQRGRRNVVAAAPFQHLRLAVLVGGLLLVQALQAAVVAFVQAPVADDVDPL